MPPNPNNGQPNKTGCGLAVVEGVTSLALDALGAIPGLGNLVSATAAGAGQLAGLWRMVVQLMGWLRDLTMKPPTEQPARAQGWALHLQMRP